MKELYLEIADTIQENPSLLRLWQVFHLIQTDHAPEFLEHIARFLPELIAHLKLIFQEQYEVDYCENALNLLNILKNKSAHHHPELRHTQHLLLDEFQDTSPLQYAILGAFIDEWSNDQQSSLFLVGDPMQSIYGFRNADVRLILNIEQQKRFHHLPIKTLQLQTNFRSNQALIAFQNQVFSDLMSPKMDINWCDIVYKPSIGIANSTPCIHQHHVDSEEDKHTQILQLLRQIPPHETVGILTPTRKIGLSILSHLQHHLDEPVLGSGLSQITQNPLIHDTLILFHAIEHPFCNLTWSSLCLTPWINASFHELQTWCQKNQKKSLYLDLLHQPSLGASHQISQLIHHQQRTHTPFQTLITILNHFNPKIVHHPDLQPLLTALEQRHIPFEDLSELFHWANQIEHTPTETSCRICITTIHQSKGLEYDHVVLPHLNNISPPTKPDIISIDSWISNKSNLPITLMASPIDDSYHQHLLNLLQKHKAQQEKKRLLYVALTRAKQSLHLFFSPNTKKNTAQHWLSRYF
jgi:ATP-dependent exoDNAse (exonuclease V) beta subunit